MLSGDGGATCYRATSEPVTGTLLMYSYMIIAVIMLVNMLIASAQGWASNTGSLRCGGVAMRDLTCCEPCVCLLFCHSDGKNL